MNRFFHWLLFKRLGFKDTLFEPLPSKYIIALAPHTSNWDFVIGVMYSKAKGINCKFLIKKEWFFWPMNHLIRSLGGIPVSREKSHGITDVLAQQAIDSDQFCLCITPEGTRESNSNWKRGFYVIAMKANLPIYLFALDYKYKTVVCTKKVIPDGNIDQQMSEIKSYFSQVHAKHPHKFVV